MSQREKANTSNASKALNALASFFVPIDGIFVCNFVCNLFSDMGKNNQICKQMCRFANPEPLTGHRKTRVLPYFTRVFAVWRKRWDSAQKWRRIPVLSSCSCPPSARCALIVYANGKKFLTKL